MTEEQKDNPTDNPSDSIIPSVSTTEYVEEPTTNIPESIPPDSKTENVNKEPIQVIVNIPKEENKTAITANRIAIIGTIINLALAGLTYLLFQKTIEANKTSQSSLVEAQKAVDQAKRANDIAEANFKLAQISSASNDSINVINLDLTKKSVSTQIVSIQQAQKTFTIENRPLIQLIDLKVDSINVGAYITVRFGLTNLGKFPAKLISAKFGMCLGKNNITTEEAEKVTTLFEYRIKSSVANGMNIPLVVNGTMPQSKEMFENYKNNIASIYLVGQILYESFVTKKHYSAKIILRINSIPVINVIGLKNEDEEI